jgi:ComF family protein
VPAWDEVVAPLPYDGPVRDWILRLKFRGADPLAPMLGAMLARSLEESEWVRQADWIVPVPLHPSRVRARGFNQSHLLAHHALASLRRRAGPKPLLRTSLLRRHRPTRPQTEVAAAERHSNVADAFSVPSARGWPGPGRPASGSTPMDEIADSHVLLIDDVLTTGATLNACARALKASGARRVSAAVLARA